MHSPLEASWFRALLVAVSFLFLGCGAHSGQATASPAEALARKAEAPAPVDDAELLRVQARAKYIVASERAAISATDLLLERKDLDPSRLRRFFVVPRARSWYALFGRLTEEGSFVPTYAFRAPIESPDQMEAVFVESLPEDFSAIARAVESAVNASVKEYGRVSVNPVVVEENEQLTVYVMQGSHDAGLYLLGGDHRFSFSKDGRTLLKATPLHKSIISVDLRKREDGKEYATSIHTHVLFPGPLETELAMVMLYPELGHLYVGSLDADAVYVLQPDGGIKVLSASRRTALKQLRPDGRVEPLDEGEAHGGP